MFKKIVLPLLSLIFVACGGDESTPELSCEQQRSALELELHVALDKVSTDADFSLAVISDDGRSFTHSVGASSMSTSYESASTSKMVSAAIILNEVKKENLSLDDTPQMYISSWPTTGNLSLIKLRDLLSFTSGLNDGLLIWGSDFEDAVKRVADNNDENRTPGANYYYGPAHLQVAGLMAIKASSETSWDGVYENFKRDTNLFEHASYDLPNQTNPRLAGGMHWSADEYLAFLGKIYKKEILTPNLIDAMVSDQRVSAITDYSPAVDGVNEDWHYGFGVWIESKSNPYDASKNSGRVSSPGLYGAYPFIDYKHKYYGILARQGNSGTFTKGYELFQSVAPQLETWASLECH